jgi:pimeloyl-ACP methyl ester carboxylesterase
VAISHWASPKARDAYEHAYAATLDALWPIRYERREIPTPFGSTHAVISGPAVGEPIVLIHAAALSATQWFPQAADLGQTRRLHAIDIMGDVGLSAQSRPVHTRQEAADWLVAVLDGLRLDAPVLMGSSFGSFLATNLAVHRPDRVRALVLLGPAATIRPFRLVARLSIRAGSLVPMPFTVRPALRSMMAGSLPDERFVRQMEVGVAGFRYDRAGIFPSEIPDRELAGLHQPTLLIVGDRERIYDPVAGLERARRLIGRLETMLIPGVGHLPGLQRPEVVDPRVRDFLSDLTARQPAREAVELLALAAAG